MIQSRHWILPSPSNTAMKPPITKDLVSWHNQKESKASNLVYNHWVDIIQHVFITLLVLLHLSSSQQLPYRFSFQFPILHLTSFTSFFCSGSCTFIYPSNPAQTDSLRRPLHHPFLFLYIPNLYQAHFLSPSLPITLSLATQLLEWEIVLLW